MMSRVCAGLLLVAGCGRFGFGTSSMADGGDAPGDVLPDAAGICHTGTWGTPLALASTQTGSEEAYPSLSVDELTLYFESNRSPSLARAIWSAARATRSDAFGTPVLVTAVDSTFDDIDPEISVDRLTLYFSSDRSGTRSLYYATRALPTDPFTFQGPVTLTNDIAGPRTGPSLTADGNTMFFARDLNVAIATRTSVSTFMYEREITEVNTSPTDGNPSISADGLELFFDSYRNGPGAIFVATRATTADPFSAPVELTSLPADPTGAFSPEITDDGRTLYFSSQIAGQDELFVVTRSCD